MACGQQPECTAEEDGQFYDLTPLRSKYGISSTVYSSSVAYLTLRATDYQVTSDTGRVFRLNVCAAVIQETWGLPNPALVGAVYRGAHSDISIG